MKWVNRRSTARSLVTLVSVLCAAIQPVSPALRASAQTTPATSTTQTAKPTTTPTAAKPAAPPAPPPVDGGWPRPFATASGAAFMVYQPQIASWTDQKEMVAYSAVAYRSATVQTQGQKPALGTVKFESNTNVSVAERLVNLGDLRISEASFPALSKDETAEIVKEITAGFPVPDRVIGLDRVLASIDASQIIPHNIDGLKADPPAIFFSKKPAILINLDGDVVWSPVQGTDLKFAINTNWDLFQYTPTNAYYLLNGQTWLTALDLSGPWTTTAPVPASFSKLPADDNWKTVKAALPAKKTTAAAPVVFTSTTPAELILLGGEPVYAPVTGTSLLWVSNTESDVFRMGKTGLVYYLVAGRWFSAPDFSGPWTFATLTLPEDFKKISLEHARSRVLASVPGSAQAAEAVLLASVPQKARVQKTLKAPDVDYNGEPQFAAIETTTVSRAVNTDKDIIKVGDLYYMCYEGVWFMSRTATGPWSVTDSVPKDIYEIPASSPSYNVTYVTVEADNDDEWVTFATAAAYTGMMVAWGCVVWGSGWYYPPYMYGGYYRPFYPTYGYGAWYNPWNGAYGRGWGAYGPYGGAGYGARYNPRTGTYARGAAVYGPGGARGYGEAYNPRTGTSMQTRQGSNVYGSWGSTSVQRGDQWANTSRVTNNRTGNTTRVTQGSGGGSVISRNTQQGGGFVGQTGGGDIYAGRDGNVYRQQGDGWQQYDNGGWNNVNTPSPTDRAGQRTGQGTASTQPANRAGDRTSGSNASTLGQLDRDARARSEGTQRTRDLGSVRSGSTPSARTGSYRPSGGGGMRSGGGRRGR